MAVWGSRGRGWGRDWDIETVPGKQEGWDWDEKEY